MITKSNSKEKDLLARLMRAEAVGEGDLGMLMVGNVVINRTITDCLTFKDFGTIEKVIYQPNQFAGTESPLFFSKATSYELKLAERVLRGEYFYPATNSLWFYAPEIGEACKEFWYGQILAGKYKNHCFYIPQSGICRQIH